MVFGFSGVDYGGLSFCVGDWLVWSWWLWWDLAFSESITVGLGFV